MRKTILTLACALFALTLPTDVVAQEGEAGAQQEQMDPTQPKKFENAEWSQAYFVEFKPGMMNEALQIIEDHFMPVNEELGREGPTEYRFMTGEWDMVVFFPMNEGPGEIAWEISPSDAEWNRVFIEREGGMEQGMQVFEDYGKTVARQKTELAMQR